MGDAKAIETRYAGYRFRSRLEARWGVFFDALEEQWTYEMEGFELSEGRYLPDFWLPRWSVWAEIKPGPLSPEEEAKCLALRDATGHAVLAIEGMPGDANYQIFAWNRDGKEVKASIGISCQLMVDTNCQMLIVTSWTRGIEHFADAGCSKRLMPFVYCEPMYAGGEVIYSAEYHESALGTAQAAARSARFEFGESGAG